MLHRGEEKQPTFLPRLYQVTAPFDLCFPPHSLPATTFDSAINEPVATEIVTVRYDFVPLARIVLFGCPTMHVKAMIRARRYEFTHPMNHAPLFAKGPSCFHARK